MASQPDRPTPAIESHPVVERAALVSLASSSPEAVRHIYKVRRGDTLSSIARSFAINVSSLRQWNRLHGNQITPGQKLTVWTRDGR
jgi:LysM repeat protein